MRSSSAGFTLLELLVVIMLIGLLSGLVGLVVGDSGGQRVRREAERLQNLLGLLREDALLHRRDYGLRVESDGYSVRLLGTDGEWRPAPTFAAHRLPEDLSLQLQRQPTAPTSPLQTGRDAPQVMVLSSDQYSPFSLQFSYQLKPRLTLHSDGLEEVRLERIE